MVLKKKLELVINHRFAVVLVSIISIILSLLGAGATGFFFLIIFTLIVLWLNQWKWQKFGLKSDHYIIWLIPRAILWTVLLLIFAFIARPVLESLFGPQDLSYFDKLRGNTRNYLITLLQVWVIVAFFEEFVYRGYLMIQYDRLFQNIRFNKVLAIVISSGIFGLSHSYQDITGIVFSGIIGLILGIVFYTNHRNLWLTVIIHGLVDTAYLTLVYTSYDLEITQLLSQIFI